MTMKTGKAYWKNKNVFITGATGLLGSWLTKVLVDNAANVVALVRDLVPRSELYMSGYHKKINIVNGCLENYTVIERTLNEYEIDTVFHLGAQTIVTISNRSPLSTFESNIKGTWNVLEAVRNSELVKRAIIASSDKAYGTQEKLPYTEDNCLKGLHPYDVSKSCADLLTQTYFNTYNLPVGITRCGNFYGGGDLNFNRSIPGTIRSLLQDEDPVIRSDGNYIRDYIYIEDAVDAYLTFAEGLESKKLWGEAFNFSTQNWMTVLDIVNKIIKIMGKRDIKPVILNQAKCEIRNQYLSSEKARRLLGWESKWPIEKGLKKTIAWYEDYFKRHFA